MAARHPISPTDQMWNCCHQARPLVRFGLQPGRYVLFVGRLVPENCAHHLVQAFRGLDTDYKCVIVGDAAYADEYQASLYALADSDPRIVFTGYVFGKGYHELGTNAAIFVEASGVGGTHPALVEAMAHGSCVVTHNTPENIETIGDAGLVYDGKIGADHLRSVLGELLLPILSKLPNWRSRPDTVPTRFTRGRK